MPVKEFFKTVCAGVMVDPSSEACQKLGYMPKEIVAKCDDIGIVVGVAPNGAGTDVVWCLFEKDNGLVRHLPLQCCCQKKLS
ncbi:MAG: hypothetical protein WC848_05030 [Parcubacteria group bacterium]|jgi:hypothetical protein